MQKVIHNPGTAPSPALADPPGPDVTTVAEVSHFNYQTNGFQSWLAQSPYPRERASYMIHSTPESEVENLVREVRQRAEYIFVTDLSVECYHGFGKSWGGFVGAMAREE
jgi:hypothetical protein